MSMATRTDTQSPELHVADSHDLIRVHGARVNNLKDVSIEMPKRRLTVFTGISGSGKSSLVFGTIAAESQRLINETYSAFGPGERCDHDRTRCRQDRETDLHPHRRHVSTLRRPGHGLRSRPLSAVRRRQVAQRGCAHDPRL
jgi:ABC-type glutathione transport system ATPase component